MSGRKVDGGAVAMEVYEQFVTTILDPGGTAMEPGGDDAHLLRSENAELRALLAIQRDLGRGPTPREVLQEVVEQVHTTLGANRSYALLWDSAAGRFEPAATAGLNDAAVAALKDFVPGQRVVPALQRALGAARPMRIEDARASDLLPAAMVAALDMGALLLVPIRGLAQDTIGVLLLDFDRLPGGASPLTPERGRLAGAVASQLSLLLQNAILYEQLRRRTLRLEALNEIGLGLAAGASGEPGALFSLLHPQVTDVVDGTLCLLAILDDGAESGADLGTTRPGATMTVWCASDGASTVVSHEAPLGRDALSAALRGDRRAIYDVREEFGNIPALPAALAAVTGDLVPASAVYQPLRLRRRTFGVLAVLSPRPHAYQAEQLEFLATVAAQTAVTLEHSRLYGVLRARGEVRLRLLDQTLQAQEAERKALVEGILDGALQELASCSYRLDLCTRLSELGQHDRCREELGETRRQLAGRIEDLRTMIGGLRPTNLDILGLQSVLRDELTAFQQRTGIQTAFHGQYTDRLDRAVETRAYRIAQELLSNVRRHAAAKQVIVELRGHDEEVVLSVSDDGVGFDAEEALRHNEGMGLHAVREGAEILGGVARVQSRPGAGTRVEIVLPRVVTDHGDRQEGQGRG